MAECGDGKSKTTTHQNDGRGITPLVLAQRTPFYGYKFRRQMPIGNYVVDFACFKAKLIVELDGGQHQDNEGYDLRRTAFLNANGWEVIRFWNNELSANEGSVLLAIPGHLHRRLPSPQPSPLYGPETW